MVYRLEYTLLDIRLNTLVLAFIHQETIHTIEMDILIHENLYLYKNKFCNVLYLISNTIYYLSIVIQF